MDSKINYWPWPWVIMIILIILLGSVVFLMLIKLYIPQPEPVQLVPAATAKEKPETPYIIEELVPGEVILVRLTDPVLLDGAKISFFPILSEGTKEVGKKYHVHSVVPIYSLNTSIIGLILFVKPRR